ncbi:hypothetical protein SAMN05428979_2972 [Stappia sp. ES.058]|nr:hypothetical protein SAMN05428979_2972 [Stappia sp. ES.058]
MSFSRDNLLIREHDKAFHPWAGREVGEKPPAVAGGFWVCFGMFEKVRPGTDSAPDYPGRGAGCIAATTLARRPHQPGGLRPFSRVVCLASARNAELCGRATSTWRERTFVFWEGGGHRQGSAARLCRFQPQGPVPPMPVRVRSTARTEKGQNKTPPKIDGAGQSAPNPINLIYGSATQWSEFDIRGLFAARLLIKCRNRTPRTTSTQPRRWRRARRSGRAG